MDAGERVVVPPLVALSIQPGWADDISVPLKKSVFYRVVLPLVLLLSAGLAGLIGRNLSFSR